MPERDPPPPRPRGRPRDEQLDSAIIEAAERQLRERGYAGMSLESVAASAGTTVPSLRRRYGSKVELATAVVDTLRIDPLPRPPRGTPRRRALAILQNFQRNLEREHSLALLGTLLAEEQRTPELLERFRARLVFERRRLLSQAVREGVSAGELPPGTDVEATVAMLVGSFYARYVGSGQIPRGWAGRVLGQIWPSPPKR